MLEIRIWCFNDNLLVNLIFFCKLVVFVIFGSLFGSILLLVGVGILGFVEIILNISWSIIVIFKICIR